MKRMYGLLILLSIMGLIGKAQIKTGFNVDGLVKGLKNGSKLCMITKRGDKIDTISTATAEKGLFKFKNVRLPVYPDFYQICIQTEFVDDLKVFLDQAEDVRIISDLKSWPVVLIIGSDAHADFQECKRRRKELQTKDFLIKYPDGIAPADTLMRYMLKEYATLIKEKQGSYYLPYAIANLVAPATKYGYSFTKEMKRPLYELLSPKVKESHYGKVLAKQVGIKE